MHVRLAVLHCTTYRLFVDVRHIVHVSISRASTTGTFASVTPAGYRRGFSVINESPSDMQQHCCLLCLGRQSVARARDTSDGVSSKRLQSRRVSTRVSDKQIDGPFQKICQVKEVEIWLAPRKCLNIAVVLFTRRIARLKKLYRRVNFQRESRVRLLCMAHCKAKVELNSNRALMLTGPSSALGGREAAPRVLALAN